MKHDNEQRTKELLQSYAQRRPIATTSRALATILISFVLTISLSKHARAHQPTGEYDVFTKFLTSAHKSRYLS